MKAEEEIAVTSLQGRTIYSDDVIIENGALKIRGQVIPNRLILRELGRGANGVVFLSMNQTLNRIEALKVWLKLKSSDCRDKAVQALKEAAKQAAANTKYAVLIYHAEQVYSVVYATMEYIKGMTLKAWCLNNHDDHEVLLRVAYHYLEAIENTNDQESFHGDPHWKNVLIYPIPGEYAGLAKLKLCDFGTSFFTNHNRSIERHWAIVKQTVIDITRPLKYSGRAESIIEHYDSKMSEIREEDKKSDGILSAKDFAMFRTVPLRDYLDYLKLEFHGWP